MFYVFLADGFEETEALVPLDLLRRAGVRVLTVGVTGETVTGSHAITVRADVSPDEIDLSDCDGVFLPGGMPGTENLYASEAVRDAVLFCAENGKLLCAICAAPIVFGRMGLLEGKRAVCFPGFEPELKGRLDCSDSVAVDGMLITAKGAGCVFPFSKAIITSLVSGEAACKVISGVQYAGI